MKRFSPENLGNTFLDLLRTFTTKEEQQQINEEVYENLNTLARAVNDLELKYNSETKYLEVGSEPASSSS